MDLGLSGARAIITGGSRGIGLAIAKQLVAEGASVAICARGADGVAAAVAQLGDHAWGEAVDVSDAEAYTGWLDRAIDHFDGCDIFIGNVALFGSPDADLADLWRSAFEIDLMHCVTGTAHLMPTLEASDRGAVVFTSSVSSTLNIGGPEEGPYGAMKAALVSYAGKIAEAAGPAGVRVNCVSPGPILFDGGIWDEVRSTEPELFAMVEQMPALQRMGTAEEVAQTVAFLASPAASYTTGTSVRVDGGTLKTANF